MNNNGATQARRPTCSFSTAAACETSGAETIIAKNHMMPIDERLVAFNCYY